MGIFGAISSVIVGWMQVNKASKLAEDWFRQGMSLFGTALVAFLGIFGTAGVAALQSGLEPLPALAYALFAASGGTAAAILALWKRSSLTKGIPILAPMSVEQKVLEGGYVYTEPTSQKEK